MKSSDYWEGYRDGIDDGRKMRQIEIIALLEEEAKQHSHPDAYYETPFGYAIALIEGENA